MMIHEVSKSTKLTKKAIAYYTSQGIITPAVLENGYRDYSERDVEILGEVYILRHLGLNVGEIKTILHDKTNEAIQAISIRRELSLIRDTKKKAILEQFISGKPYADIKGEIEAIEQAETIAEKLLFAFPGYYGRFICVHFSRFLDMSIQSKEQRSAYEAILSFLDDVSTLKIPKEIEYYLIKGTKHIGFQQLAGILDASKSSIENFEEFLANNEDTLEAYLAYRQSDEYKRSPACKLMMLMKDFNASSGYYEVFIPAMKQLSPTYAEYCRKIEIANEKLLEKYPQAAKLVTDH